MGRLVQGNLSRGFVPPLAGAVLSLLQKHGQFLLDVVSLFISTFVLRGFNSRAARSSKESPV